MEVATAHELARGATPMMAEQKPDTLPTDIASTRSESRMGPADGWVGWMRSALMAAADNRRSRDRRTDETFCETT